MAIAATAWIGRDLSELAAQPVVFGLAYLAFALAVAIRFGAIPFHAWAARLTDAVPETDAAARDGDGPGGLRDRGPGLGGRVDRAARRRSTSTPPAPSSSRSPSPRSCSRRWRPGSRTTSSTSSATRSSATPGSCCWRWPPSIPAAWAPARTWILAFVVARSAFAAWAAATRTTFSRAGSPTCAAGRSGRRPSAVTLVLVIVASIGLPGLAALDARTALVQLALDGPLATLVLLGTLAPARVLRPAARGRPRARPDGAPVARTWRPSPRAARRDRRCRPGWAGRGRDEPGAHGDRRRGSSWRSSPSRSRPGLRWAGRRPPDCRRRSRVPQSNRSRRSEPTSRRIELRDGAGLAEADASQSATDPSDVASSEVPHDIGGPSSGASTRRASADRAERAR